MTSFLGLYIRPGYLEIAEAQTGENARYVGSMPISDNRWGASDIVAILKDKSLGLKKSYEGITFALSSGHEMYRKMTFPFGKDQVEKTIQFEFFDQVKDSIIGTSNDYLFDYKVIEAGEQRTVAMGVCSPEKEIRELIEGLEKIDFDPEKVTPELSAVSNFVKMRIPFVASGHAMLLHTTPEDVYIVFLQQGEVSEFRQLKIKLGDIRSVKTGTKPSRSQPSVRGEKQVVKSEYDEEETFYKIVSFTKQEIEEIKTQQTEITPEGVVEPSEAKKNALKRLLIQLQRTLFLMPEAPNELIISGTYANDKEVIDAIHAFGMKVFEAESNVDLEHAASLGAVLTFFNKENAPLNFRQGALEYKGFFEKVVPPLIVCMTFLLAITVVMNVFLVRKHQILKAETAKIKVHSQKIAQSVEPANEQFKKETNVFEIEKKLNATNKKTDFEANVNEYEKRHPIISCLKVWLEYEKTKNNAMMKKIAIANEQGITINQTNSGVKMDIAKARAAGFGEAVDFLKMLKSLKYFDESKEKEMKQDVNNNEVVFDFYVLKNY